MAGINLVNVPYRSSYLPDLIGGQVQAAFTPILQSAEYIRAGRLRALAVTGVGGGAAALSGCANAAAAASPHEALSTSRREYLPWRMA